MSRISLTFVTSTYNKLLYIKETYKDLLANAKSDEEILVADGGSTDGTPTYLSELLDSGKIAGFISEKDSGESHALNKLFLMVKGDLITLVTDDDAFDFEAIESCKKFMLDHPEIDILSTNGGFKGQGDCNVRNFEDTPLYKEWLKNHTPFMSCGLGIMFRKSALPLLGFWNPSFKRADAEYLLRTTEGPANMAWYTGWSYVNISNPQSVSVVYRKKIDNETDRLLRFYLNKKPALLITKKTKAAWSKLRAFVNKKRVVTKIDNRPAHEKWKDWYKTSKDWLHTQNSQIKGEFLYKK